MSVCNFKIIAFCLMHMRVILLNAHEYMVLITKLFYIFVCLYVEANLHKGWHFRFLLADSCRYRYTYDYFYFRKKKLIYFVGAAPVNYAGEAAGNSLFKRFSSQAQYI